MPLSCTNPAVDEPADLVAPGTAPVPDSDETRCSCDIYTEPGPTVSIRVLRVSGEIDMMSCPTMRTAMDAALFGADDGPTSCLVVDVSGVTFCSAQGLTLLHDTAHDARESGTTYALAGLSTHLTRVTTLLWADDPTARYASSASAITAIRARQLRGPADQSPGR